MSPHALIAQWVKVKIHTKDIIAYLEVNVHSLTEQQPTQTQTWVVFFELVLIFKPYKWPQPLFSLTLWDMKFYLTINLKEKIPLTLMFFQTCMT